MVPYSRLLILISALIMGLEMVPELLNNVSCKSVMWA